MRLHYLIQLSLIWRVHVLQERSEIQEMDLVDVLSFFPYYKTILKTLKEKLTSVKLFSRFSKPFETCHNNE